MNKSSQIIVRMAPSPTGFLHVGTARTALFNYIFSRHVGGQYILRIEDTDRERSNKEYEKDIIEGLAWLGIKWDGDIVRQSERRTAYEKAINSLISSGNAFWCNHSKEELEMEQESQMENHEPPRHVCSDKDKNLESGQVIRLKVDTNSEREIEFDDIIRGRVSFKENLLGDFSIAKDGITPLYNFAVVVDDIDMNISHVIRGEDHISNTPKQILIYEALSSDIPQFAHLPLILGPDRSKLSKRHSAESLSEYKKDYLPDAVVNFLGSLGYTYSNEILTLDEMSIEFDLAKVHKSGAVFDIKKLNWMNSQYVRRLSANELKRMTGIDQIPDSGVPLITERLEKLSQVKDYSYLWSKPEYDSSLLTWKDSSMESVLKSLEESKQIIESFEYSDGKEKLRKALDELSKKIGDRGLVYWPIRVALSGKEKSPDPIDISFAIGKEETIRRVNEALGK